MSHWKRSRAKILGLGAWCVLASMAQAQPSPTPGEKPGARPIIGFVEDVPATEQVAGPGKPVALEPHVRVAFAKTADGWKYPVVIKRRTHGYDGKGQCVLDRASDAPKAAKVLETPCKGKTLAEPRKSTKATLLEKNGVFTVSALYLKGSNVEHVF